MTVLIVTRTDDNDCVPTVVEALRRRGAQVVRFDTDRFPTEIRVAVRYDGPRDLAQLIAPEGAVDLAEVTTVWHRRLAFGKRISVELEPQLRDACIQESRATAMGLIASLGAFHLDREADIRYAQHKQLQLRVARDLGLEIPRTLITNDPDAVRAFVADCPAGVMAKMLSSFAVHEQGREKVVFTTPMRPSDLERLNGLELSPMTFQERVPKALELRVTVVGERVMAAAVDSSVAGAGDDWRRQGEALMNAWRPHPLPREVEGRVLRLMDHFGLNYGAIDLILTPDGRWVFLEVNPVGEFFWLDRLFTPSISDALADTLLGLAPRREGPTPAARSLGGLLTGGDR
jgi:glutathione synthase/RimK-type ligase-like ATP-grasp enzyme